MSKISSAVEIKNDEGNPIPVSGTVSVTDIATATKQSDGSQKTQVVDGSGNVVGSNALNPAPTDRGIVSRNVPAAFAVQIDEPDANTVYVGEAALGTATSAASWRIKKVATSGNVTAITFADSNANYDNIFDNRVALSYG